MIFLGALFDGAQLLNEFLQANLEQGQWYIVFRCNGIVVWPGWVIFVLCDGKHIPRRGKNLYHRWTHLRKPPWSTPPSRTPAYKTRREQAAAARAERAAGQEKTAKTTLEDAKKLLDGSALTNRNLLIAFYVLLTTGLMLCLGIGDEQLLLNKAPVPLPFLNLTLPIWAFASVVPLLLLVGHFDLLHNLNEHSRKLQAWLRAWEGAKHKPALGEAGALSDQLFPFVYDFAWLHTAGKGQNNINSKLLPGLCWALYCWAPFTVLIIFFIRFADLQNYWFTGWHLLLILLDAAWLYWYWPQFPDQTYVKELKKLLNSISTAALCWTLWLFIQIQLFLDFAVSPLPVLYAIDLEADLSAFSSITLVPRITVPGFEAQLPPNHFAMAKVLAPGKTEAELWPNTGPSINLTGRRLGFADLSSAVLPRANLARVKLGYARLDEINLHAAIMTASKLPGALLVNANLASADLSDANLQGTFLIGAYLPGSNLPGAKLHGSILNGADLQGVNLYDAYLPGADLQATNLRGAFLASAKLQGADLRRAKLQGTYLKNAKLQGASMDNATMHGTIIHETYLLGATLPNTIERSVIIGTPRWDKPEEYPDWLQRVAYPYHLSFYWDRLREQLETAAQRIKSAKPRVMPQQDGQQFTQAWLNTICQNKATANSMLKVAVIPSATLGTWLDTHPECQPYRALFEAAMKRGGGLDSFIR